MGREPPSIDPAWGIFAPGFWELPHMAGTTSPFPGGCGQKRRPHPPLQSRNDHLGPIAFLKEVGRR